MDSLLGLESMLSLLPGEAGITETVMVSNMLSFAQLLSGDRRNLSHFYSITDRFDLFQVCVHYSLARAGLLCVGTGEEAPSPAPPRSELLPAAWNSQPGLFSLHYQDSEGAGYLLKGVEAEPVLHLSLLNLATEKSADLSLAPGDEVLLGTFTVFSSLHVIAG